MALHRNPHRPGGVTTAPPAPPAPPAAATGVAAGATTTGRRFIHRNQAPGTGAIREVFAVAGAVDA